VALANIVFVVMYFNWFYHEGLPKALKEMNLMCCRSINPSRIIYSFFDYGDFKIFGLQKRNIVKDRKAEIHLIAGTFKRTGDDEKMLILLNNYPKTRKKIVNMLCWLT
jgi:hypothetical protein